MLIFKTSLITFFLFYFSRPCYIHSDIGSIFWKISIIPFIYGLVLLLVVFYKIVIRNIYPSLGVFEHISKTITPFFLLLSLFLPFLLPSSSIFSFFGLLNEFIGIKTSKQGPVMCQSGWVHWFSPPSEEPGFPHTGSG